MSLTAAHDALVLRCVGPLDDGVLDGLLTELVGAARDDTPDVVVDLRHAEPSRGSATERFVDLLTAAAARGVHAVVAARPQRWFAELARAGYGEVLLIRPPASARVISLLSRGAA